MTLSTLIGPWERVNITRGSRMGFGSMTPKRGPSHPMLIDGKGAITEQQSGRLALYTNCQVRAINLYTLDLISTWLAVHQGVGEGLLLDIGFVLCNGIM